MCLIQNVEYSAQIFLFSYDKFLGKKGVSEYQASFKSFDSYWIDASTKPEWK